MSASPNGSAHSVCDDAMRRTEMVLDNALEAGLVPFPLRNALATERDALRSARALADSRAALDAPEMGGTTLTLTLEEARLLRAALLFAAEEADGWSDTPEGDGVKLEGVLLTHDGLMAIRKRINAGVSRNAERRTGGAA